MRIFHEIVATIQWALLFEMVDQSIFLWCKSIHKLDRNQIVRNTCKLGKQKVWTFVIKIDENGKLLLMNSMNGVFHHYNPTIFWIKIMNIIHLSKHPKKFRLLFRVYSHGIQCQLFNTVDHLRVQYFSSNPNKNKNVHLTNIDSLVFWWLTTLYVSLNVSMWTWVCNTIDNSDAFKKRKVEYFKT